MRVAGKNGKINTIKHDIKELIQFENSKNINDDINIRMTAINVNVL